MDIGTHTHVSLCEQLFRISLSFSLIVYMDTFCHCFLPKTVSEKLRDYFTSYLVKRQ